jgi:hypothetical protein
MQANLVVVARSKNAKTGDVPTVWVGRSLEESRASCAGCEQLETGNCYAQYGSPSFAISSIHRSAARAKSWRRYTIHRALKQRDPSARFVRFSALGDVARADREQVTEAFAASRHAGLAIVGYTHFWSSDGKWLRGKLMASCDSPSAAMRANAAGWRAAIVMPANTTGTMRNLDGSVFAVECPAVAAARYGKTFTCNDCASGKRGALCDATVEGPNVYFADHGPRTRNKRSLPVLA